MGNNTNQFIDDEYLYTVFDCSKDPWYIKFLMISARFMQKHRIAILGIFGFVLLSLLAYFAFTDRVDPAIFALGVLLGLAIATMVIIWFLLRN